MQSNSVEPLELVLPERIRQGFTIFQGRSRSGPLEMLLKERRETVRPLFMDLSDRTAVIEYRKEDQVISVESGISLAALSGVLAASGQYLPCFARDDRSLLEIINSGETGYFEHSYGLRALVLGLEVCLANGEMIKMGGKVVKNVTGYDLTKLFLGSRGTLGVPTKAHIRVYARPQQEEMFVASGIDFDGLLELAGNLVRSGLSLTGLELVFGGEKQKWLDNGLNDEKFLLIAVSEHAAVMSELAPLIEDHCRKMNANIQRVESAQQTALMHNIEDSFAPSHRLLSMSASRSQCKKIYAALSAIGEIELFYRPGVGKLRLLFLSPENMQQGIKLLSNFLDNIDIAYADSEFELRVERLPETDSQLEHIKQELKRRFDADNKMNPLAKL